MSIPPVYYNVQASAFNAPYDGVTDATTAIHLARDTAGPGATLMFPPGAYKVNGLVANVANQAWVALPGASFVGSNPIITVSASGVILQGDAWDGNTVDQRTNAARIVRAAASGNNLLANGGLESWLNGSGPITATGATADNWTLTLGASSTASVSKDTTNQDSGSGACLAVTYTHAAETTIGQPLANYAECQGMTLTLSVRVKTSTANAVRPFIYGNVNGYHYGSYHNGNGNYQTLTVTATMASSGLTFVMVGIALDASCTAYLDNASLVVGNAPFAYQATSPLTLPALVRFTPPVILAVDTSLVTFSGIPQTYRDLRLRITAKKQNNVNVNGDFNMRYNADTGANYDYVVSWANGGASPASGTYEGIAQSVLDLAWLTTGSSANVHQAGSTIIDILDYANAAWWKNHVFCGYGSDAVTGRLWSFQGGGTWHNTAAITSISLFDSNGNNLAAGSTFELFGVP